MPESSAAESQVAGAVVVHHHRRVKQPCHIGAVRRVPGNQQLPELIPPGAGRAVRGQDADAVAAVAEIQEELLLPVNRLVRGARCPGIVRAPGDSAGAGHADAPVVRPVHHIIGGDAVDAPDLAVGILLHVSGGIPLDDVVRHKDVQPPVIFHYAGICPEPLGIEGVVLSFFLVRYNQLDVLACHNVPDSFHKGRTRCQDHQRRHDRRDADDPGSPASDHDAFLPVSDDFEPAPL